MVTLVAFSKFYTSGADMCYMGSAICKVVVCGFLTFPNVEEKTKFICFYPSCWDAFNFVVVVLYFLSLVQRAILRWLWCRNGLANLLTGTFKKG